MTIPHGGPDYAALSARVSSKATAACTNAGSAELLDGRDGARHDPSGLSPEGQLVDGILRLDVELFAGRVAEHATDRGGHHPVTIGVAEDDHAATDAGVADQVARVTPPNAERRALSAVVADLSRGDADQVSS